MTETRSFASLGPSLLARKGGARPAMRPQLQPLHQFHEATARQIDDDLGWNDMGHDAPAPHAGFQAMPVARLAEVVALNPEGQPPAELPPVLHQREAIAAQVGAIAPAEASTPRGRASAQLSARPSGRRAAFTLRLDAERHLKLRLACTLANRSAQHLVTDALDQLLDALPDVTELAAQVRKSQ